MKMMLVPLVFACALSAGDVPVLQPKELAATLSTQSGERPVLFHVGFPVLYRNKHIPGSTYAGPGAKPEGIETLKAAAAKLPRDRQIVLYCGCCPWDRCPNIKPAIQALREMGFQNVKALYIANTMAKDWFDQGYPAELGSAAAK